MAKGQPATLLAPGFRFHPTDEELVRFYLKRKVANKPFKVDAISVVDVYKSEPWDLPGKSKLKSRDLEWYFFSVLDKKYNNGSKTNRATEKGYWKTTGKDRVVRCGSRSVGMKKTLVYHQGRAPRGERSNWVMHEYRLTNEELEKGGLSQKDAFVLCRIFQKSGTGPKNGERYGAPLVEEEWDDDDEVEVAVLPGDEVAVAANEVTVADDEYVETNDLFQNFNVHAAFEDPVPPIIYGYGDANNYENQSGDVIETDLKPPMDEGLSQPAFDMPDDQNNLFGLHGQQHQDSTLIDEAFVAQSSNSIDSAEVNYTFDPYYVANDNPYCEGFVGGHNNFLNNILNSVEPESLIDSGFDMVEEYLNFFDAEDENLTFDVSELVGSESSALEPASETKVVKGETEDVPNSTRKLLETHVNDDASCSKKSPEPFEYEPDTKPSYFKQMLGGIPAYASEFPLKGAAVRLQPGQSSTSIHVTADIIRIESTISGADAVDWSFSKSRDVNVILSFPMSEENLPLSSFVPAQSLFLGKPPSAVSLSWIFLMLFWVLLFSISYRIGSFVSAK